MQKATRQIKVIGIELLKYFGNLHPTKQQIETIIFILNSFITTNSVHFHSKLSSREISCLFWAAMGMTSDETATVLKISATTVESHRKKIKKKLNCCNLAQAIFTGMRWGYIKKSEEFA